MKSKCLYDSCPLKVVMLRLLKTHFLFLQHLPDVFLSSVALRKILGNDQKHPI